MASYKVTVGERGKSSTHDTIEIVEADSAEEARQIVLQSYNDDAIVIRSCVRM